MAVFVDGAFWHGHPSAYKPGKSGTYWDEKIARNKERDAEANRRLEEEGWTVLRFWDFEIKRNLGTCVATVEAALRRGSGRE